MTMKKAFYYNFIPSKEEELHAIQTRRPYQVTRTLVEIRDNYELHPREFDQNNPWRIRKRLEIHEVATGKIHLTHAQVFENIFKYASLETANNIIMGNKISVAVCDMSDSDKPMMYGPRDEQTFFEKGLHEEYVLGLNMALVRSRGFKKDDEVAIYFDPRTHVFYLKLLTIN